MMQKKKKKKNERALCHDEYGKSVGEPPLFLAKDKIYQAVHFAKGC